MPPFKQVAIATNVKIVGYCNYVNGPYKPFFHIPTMFRLCVDIPEEVLSLENG